jgi:hypothetical protein
MAATQQILYICTHTTIPHSYTYSVFTKPHILLFTYSFPCSNISLHIPVATKPQIPINTSLSPSYTFYTYLLPRNGVCVGMYSCVILHFTGYSSLFILWLIFLFMKLKHLTIMISLNQAESRKKLK